MADQALAKAVDSLAMLYLKRELDEAVTVDETGRVRQDWDRRRKAAQEIVRRAGLLPAVRALAPDGALRPPPMWPSCDIVASGGGKGFVDSAVRTIHPMRGLVQVTVRIPVKVGEKPTQDQIGTAYMRGQWQLKKRIEQ